MVTTDRLLIFNTTFSQVRGRFKLLLDTYCQVTNFRTILTYFWKSIKFYSIFPYENFFSLWSPRISISFCFEALERRKISPYDRARTSLKLKVRKWVRDEKLFLYSIEKCKMQLLVVGSCTFLPSAFPYFFLWFWKVPESKICTNIL